MEGSKYLRTFGAKHGETPCYEDALDRVLKGCREQSPGHLGPPRFPGGLNEGVARKGERDLDGISIGHSHLP
jgi:hypothetical protein